MYVLRSNRISTSLGLIKYFRLREFHHHARLHAIKPFILADIGEGITECQLIQWFVQPGARVEQFDKICEVQSDKASVEITSPYDGIIKKLHYDVDDMAITGKPLVDIDSNTDTEEADHEATDQTNTSESLSMRNEEADAESGVNLVDQAEPSLRQSSKAEEASLLATPAVRHLMKEHNIKAEDIAGTGKDGRVLKEDVYRHVKSVDISQAKSTTGLQDSRSTTLSPVQAQMYKVMTRSLNIPHFLFTTTAVMSEVTSIRQKLNAVRIDSKITPFAFIIKAVSMAFCEHEILNASLDSSNTDKPILTYHSSHDFGIAVDTPSGLLVPVIRNIQTLSISEIAEKLQDISGRARSNGLQPGNFQGATFTLSNIGSVGGGVVSPVISSPQVAVLGVGRSKVVPAFNDDGELCKREEMVLSWSADHRVVNGAECARCAEHVIRLLEDPSLMMVDLR